MWCTVEYCEGSSNEFKCEPCPGEVVVIDNSFDGNSNVEVGCQRCGSGSTYLVIASASAPISKSSFDCVKSCIEEDDDYKEKCAILSVTSAESSDLIDKCEAKCSTSSSARS